MESANDFKPDYDFHGVKVKYSKLEEKLGMYGPMVGQISINGVEINGYFSGPPLISTDQSKLLLPKFEFRNIKEVFKIFILDIIDHKCYTSKTMFSSLYLSSFNNNFIELFDSNYASPGKELKLKFDLNNFEMGIC